MIDTSALVAALVDDHEHHRTARRCLGPGLRVPAVVLAETYSQLRRTFGQSAAASTSLLRHWTENEQHILPTTPSAVATVFSRATELDLGGNVHDALVAQTCVEHAVSLATLDGRQHRVALALGAASTYLLLA